MLTVSQPTCLCCSHPPPPAGLIEAVGPPRGHRSCHACWGQAPAAAARGDPCLVGDVAPFGAVGTVVSGRERSWAGRNRTCAGGEPPVVTHSRGWGSPGLGGAGGVRGGGTEPRLTVDSRGIRENVTTSNLVVGFVFFPNILHFSNMNHSQLAQEGFCSYFWLWWEKRNWGSYKKK